MKIHYFSVLQAEDRRGSIRSVRGYGANKSPRIALDQALSDCVRKLDAAFPSCPYGGTPIYEEVCHAGRIIRVS